jgi:hypothetical protein
MSAAPARVSLHFEEGDAVFIFCETPSIVLGDLPGPLPDDGSEMVDSAGARWSKIRIPLAQYARALQLAGAANDGEAGPEQRTLHRIAIAHAMLAIPSPAPASKGGG